MGNLDCYREELRKQGSVYGILKDGNPNMRNFVEKNEKTRD